MASRSGPTQPEKERRRKAVAFRADPDALEGLKARAEAAGLKPAAYVERLVLRDLESNEEVAQAS